MIMQIIMMIILIIIIIENAARVTAAPMLTFGCTYFYDCISEFILVGENVFARPKGALRLSARRAFGAP